MIYYFTGTGNSQYVAQQLAQALDMEIGSLVGVEKPVEAERYIVVSPIYAWLLPEMVERFLKRLARRSRPIYLVVTCGDNVGRAIEKLKLPLVGAYSVIMPNNYVIGMDIDSKELQAKKLAQAKPVIAAIARDISAGIGREDYEKGRWAWHFGSAAGRLFRRLARSTRYFRAESTCILCERCVKNCPSQAIARKAQRILWIKSQCEMCLKCFHACPVNAIQYGKMTQNKSQYTIPTHLLK